MVVVCEVSDCDRDVTGLNTGAGHSALHQLGMHRIQNFQIRPDPDMLDPPGAGSDPHQTKLTTTMCITLLRWTCTKTDVWRFVYDICSLACPVIFSCWQWHHVSSEMLKIKNLCSISLLETFQCNTWIRIQWFWIQLVQNPAISKSGSGTPLASGISYTCLCLPSLSWYSFTDPGGMEGWVDLGAK